MKLNADKFKTKQDINCKRAGKIKTSERCSRSSVIPFPLLLVAVLKTETSAQCKLLGVSNYWLRLLYPMTQSPSYQFSKPLKRLKFSIAIPASCSLSHTIPEGYKCDQRQCLWSKGRGERRQEKGATYPADFLLCCATGRCKFKENCGDAERRERETPWGLSGKSMPEFHHSNCRENMA